MRRLREPNARCARHRGFGRAVSACTRQRETCTAQQRCCLAAFGAGSGTRRESSEGSGSAPIAAHDRIRGASWCMDGRAGEDPPRGAPFDDLACVHHHGVAAELGNDTELVRDERDGASCLLLQVLQQPNDCDPGRGTARRCGFVGDQVRHFHLQRRGDGDPPLHATGIFMRLPCECSFGIRNADAPQHYSRLCFFSRLYEVSLVQDVPHSSTNRQQGG